MVRDRNLSARARQHLDRPGADRQSVGTLAHCGTLGRPACQDIALALHVLMDHKRDRLTTLKRASPPTDRTHRSTSLSDLTGSGLVIRCPLVTRSDGAPWAGAVP